MSVICSVEELRSVLGEEIPGLNEKNTDHLDSYAIEFIKKSPFLVLTTSDAQGRCDASPKEMHRGLCTFLMKRKLLYLIGQVINWPTDT